MFNHDSSLYQKAGQGFRVSRSCIALTQIKRPHYIALTQDIPPHVQTSNQSKIRNGRLKEAEGKNSHLHSSACRPHVLIRNVLLILAYSPLTHKDRNLRLLLVKCNFCSLIHGLAAPVVILPPLVSLPRVEGMVDTSIVRRRGFYSHRSKDHRDDITRKLHHQTLLQGKQARYPSGIGIVIMPL